MASNINDWPIPFSFSHSPSWNLANASRAGIFVLTHERYDVMIIGIL